MKWFWRCVLALGSAACEPDDGVPDDAVACASEEAPTWESFSAGFLEAHCTRCHATGRTGGERMGAPPGYDFDRRDIAQRLAFDMEEQLEQGAMPPDGELPSAEDVARFRRWITCGTP